MRLNQVTGSEFGVLFERLCIAYQHRIPEKWKSETMKVYFDEVRKFDKVVVEKAVAKLISEPTRGFPRAGELRGQCFGAERDEKRQQPHTQTAPNDQCTDCRKNFYVAGYECGNGVVVGRLRCACRQGGAGWDTEAAKSFRESHR